MMKKNILGIAELSDEQSARLIEAMEMIAGDDKKLYTKILEATSKNLHKFIGNSKDEEVIAQAVDKAESMMPDIAFGNSGKIIDDFLNQDKNISDEEEILDPLLSEKSQDDTFMGDEHFTSLDAIAEEENVDDYSYDTLQEDWN